MLVVDVVVVVVGVCCGDKVAGGVLGQGFSVFTHTSSLRNHPGNEMHHLHYHR